MTGVDAHAVRFQCPKCGHELEQTIGQIKSSDHTVVQDVASGSTLTLTGYLEPPTKFRKPSRKCPRRSQSNFTVNRAQESAIAACD